MRLATKIKADTIPSSRGKKKFHSMRLKAVLKRTAKINFKKAKSNIFNE